MKWLMLLYPRQWRARYGEEFVALLEQTNGGWREALNIAKGVIVMRLSTVRCAALGALTGLVVGLAFWGLLDPGYNARIAIPRSKFKVCHGSINNCDPKFYYLDPAEELQSEQARLDKQMLTILIDQYELYRQQRTSKPLDEIIRTMRSKITVELGTEEIFLLTFAHPDRAKAEEVVKELAALCGHNNQKALLVGENHREPLLKPVTLGLLLGTIAGPGLQTAIAKLRQV